MNAEMTKISPRAEIHVHENLESIAGNFKGVVLDAYGVFWGGNDVGLLPGSEGTMKRLVEQGKIVGILSNTTQIAKNEIQKLAKHGLIEGVHFHFFISSGDVAKRLFIDNDLPFPTIKKKYYLFGTEHPKFSSHHGIFEGSLFQQTEKIEDADFIYISIPHIDGVDQTDPSVFSDSLKKIVHYKLPMICTNPDQFAHEGHPPKAVVRQGSIAKMYKEMGGDVHYIGKPSERMFQAAMDRFNHFNIDHVNDVIMVGDTPETDIRGAKGFGMSSALTVKTGIMAERILEQNMESAINKLDIEEFPNYFIESMGKK